MSCYDRIVITGTLPGACFAEGMTSFLNSRGIRIFDYPQFALPLRESLAQHLGVVRRTLHRQLAREGETFSGIVDGFACLCRNVKNGPMLWLVIDDEQEDRLAGVLSPFDLM